MSVGVIWSPLEKNQSEFWAHLKMPKILIFVVESLSQQMIIVEQISKPLEALLGSFGYYLTYSNCIMIQLWNTQSLDNRSRVFVKFSFSGNRVICSLHWSFGRELVFWHTILSMFGRFSVHAWSWCGGLNQCWTGIVPFISFGVIYNEDFILFDGYGYGFLTLFLFSMPFGSIYNARAFISR